MLVSPLHQRSNRGGRCVKNRRFVLLDDLPPAVFPARVGKAFVHNLGDAVNQRSINDVTVSRYPANVGGRPTDVGVGLYVKDVVVRGGSLSEVAPRGVKYSLGLGGRARGVHDEHRVFGVKRLI